MDLMKASKIAASGLHAQRTKMNVIAANLANAETTRTPEGGPYKRKMVVFEAKPLDQFKRVLEEKRREREAAGLTGETEKSMEIALEKPPEKRFTGVEVTEIVESQEDFQLVYNPSHPDADPVTGYVAMPNVDHLTEMADMIVARRAYDANIAVISNTKAMVGKALEIGR